MISPKDKEIIDKCVAEQYEARRLALNNSTYAVAKRVPQYKVMMSYLAKAQVKRMHTMLDKNFPSQTCQFFNKQITLNEDTYKYVEQKIQELLTKYQEL